MPFQFQGRNFQKNDNSVFFFIHLFFISVHSFYLPIENHCFVVLFAY